MTTKRINLSFSIDREDDLKVYRILSEQKYKTDYVINAVLSYIGERDKGFDKEKIKEAVKEAIEETSRNTGKIETKSTTYAWISGKELKKSNVEKRCMKLGRYRWKIENNFLVEKHQGYVFEHCFSYNWNAMKGFHFLMKIGKLINVLVTHSEFAAPKILELGIRGFISKIFDVCKSDVLNIDCLKSIVENQNYQLRLVI
jgi:hypothetical protein